MCSCLYKFLHGRGHKQVNTKTIQCLSVGQKDQNKGLFHLWQAIFQLQRTKRYRMSCQRFGMKLKMFFCICWMLRPFSEITTLGSQVFKFRRAGSSKVLSITLLSYLLPLSASSVRTN